MWWSAAALASAGGTSRGGCEVRGAIGSGDSPWVFGTEIAQEVASCPTEVPRRAGTERSGQGIDRALEDRSQTMLERGASRAAHEEILGRGRRHWATARAYCR